MTDIFISYAREDKERAELLSNAFSRQGWSVWWDREIPPGQSFDEMIENALHSARCVIVLWSKDSVLSRWVKTEAAEGAARGILIPVLMDKVQIPLEFKRIEAADLSDWQGTTSHFEFDQLLKTVAGVLSGSTSTGVKRVPTTKMRARRWWETMPGILAATGGVIAVTMLIVVLYQTRVIDSVIGHIPETQNGTTTPTEATKHPALPRAAVPSPTGQAAQYPRSLALRTEVRLNSVLGDAVYKILAVQLDRHNNVEKLALRFKIRATCLNGYGVNFWDNSFRLLVDGVPTAPVSNLNKVVQARSAEEGEVIFVIPAETQSTVLSISNGSESTEIPVDLSAEIQPPTEATKHPALPRAAVPSPTGQPAQYPRSLALRTEVRLNSALGDGVYKILAVQLDRHNVEKLALRFTIRMTCLNGPSGCNFWDNSFRLVVDGVPTAPVSNVNTMLNKYIPPRSAGEGEVMFVIPAATQSTVLVISNGSESTDIPVDLASKTESADKN
jgi:hypothetical protein